MCGANPPSCEYGAGCGGGGLGAFRSRANCAPPAAAAHIAPQAAESPAYAAQAAESPAQEAGAADGAEEAATEAAG